MLHGALHEFRTRRGTGAATLEANLYQNLEGPAHKPLFQVLIYVRNTYNFLDREWCLELRIGYGLGKNLDRLLEKYWRRHRIVPKLGKYLGTVFGAGIGLTQGDPASPMIFNIVVDAVVRAVLE